MWGNECWEELKKEDEYNDIKEIFEKHLHSISLKLFCSLVCLMMHFSKLCMLSLFSHVNCIQCVFMYELLLSLVVDVVVSVMLAHIFASITRIWRFWALKVLCEFIFIRVACDLF